MKASGRLTFLLILFIIIPKNSLLLLHGKSSSSSDSVVYSTMDDTSNYLHRKVNQHELNSCTTSYCSHPNNHLVLKRENHYEEILLPGGNMKRSYVRTKNKQGYDNIFYDNIIGNKKKKYLRNNSKKQKHFRSKFDTHNNSNEEIDYNHPRVFALSQFKFSVSGDNNTPGSDTHEIAFGNPLSKKKMEQPRLVSTSLNANSSKSLPVYVSDFLNLCEMLMSMSTSNGTSDAVIIDNIISSTNAGSINETRRKEESSEESTLDDIISSQIVPVSSEANYIIEDEIIIDKDELERKIIPSLFGNDEPELFHFNSFDELLKPKFKKKSLFKSKKVKPKKRMFKLEQKNLFLPTTDFSFMVRPKFDTDLSFANDDAGDNTNEKFLLKNSDNDLLEAEENVLESTAPYRDISFVDTDYSESGITPSFSRKHTISGAWGSERFVIDMYPDITRRKKKLKPKKSNHNRSQKSLINVNKKKMRFLFRDSSMDEGSFKTTCIKFHRKSTCYPISNACSSGKPTYVIFNKAAGSLKSASGTLKQKGSASQLRSKYKQNVTDSTSEEHSSNTPIDPTNTSRSNYKENVTDSTSEEHSSNTPIDLTNTSTSKYKQHETDSTTEMNNSDKPINTAKMLIVRRSTVADYSESFCKDGTIVNTTRTTEYHSKSSSTNRLSPIPLNQTTTQLPNLYSIARKVSLNVTTLTNYKSMISNIVVPRSSNKASTSSTLLPTAQIKMNVSHTATSSSSEKVSKNPKYKEVIMIGKSTTNQPSTVTHTTKHLKALNNFGVGEDDRILPFDNSTTSVGEYVEYLIKKSENMYRKHRRAMWDYESNKTHQTRKKSMVSSLEITQFQRNLNEALEPLKSCNINNSTLERQIKLLYLPGMALLPDFKITEFEQVLFAMNTIYNTAAVNEWQSPTHRVSLNPVITKRMATSRDPDELRYYWLEWRNVTGRRIRSLYEQYVELMNMTARTNGFNDAGEMWTRRYETEDFMQLLGSQWEDIRPLYKDLHAYVRHNLHQTYGDVTDAKDSGTIPVHLTGDIWGQDWRNLYNMVAPYRDDLNLMEIDLSEKKYTQRKMVSEAEKMFHSLGFPKLPPTFWSKSIFAPPNTTSITTSMVCKSSVWDMLSPTDYRVKFCGGTTLDDFFKVHELLAKVEYYTQFQDLPFPFKEAANPSFGDAIAGAIVLSAKSKKHLELTGILSKQRKNAFNDINFLLRVALEKVAFLPYSYVVDLWRYRVFQGEIESSEYNQKWWDLRSQYQGVSPPVARTEDDFDIGSIQEVVTNEPYIKYFLSTLMEFQVYEALCEKSGHIGELHDCDITSSSKAGQTLRKVMSMGASQHWKVPMKELTGERRLQSSPMVKYFRPLHKWLKKRLSETRQSVGWQNT